MLSIKTCFTPAISCIRKTSSTFITLNQVNTILYSVSSIAYNKSLLNNTFLNTFHSKSCVKMSSESKKSRAETLKIGTHDGRFHCDEILACFMLKNIEKYRDAEIVRSRNQSILDTCDIVIDVGGIFDKDLNKFDHHQRSFNETLSSLRPELGTKYDIRLSSAGLIYTYFGEELISNIVKEQKNITLSTENIELIYKKIYENFIREIDAIDNGVQICDGEPRYQIATHLSARVNNFNPSWDNDCPEDESILFEKAKGLVGMEFVDKVLNYATSWLPAREIVKESIENSKNVYETGEILELSRPCPWKDHLPSLEEKFNVIGLPKYVLMCDQKDDWRVICVPRQPRSFICRKFLHKDWRGLRKNELMESSGIEDAEFCHATGFIGGARSREGVLQMAIKSLKGDYID